MSTLKFRNSKMKTVGFSILIGFFTVFLISKIFLSEDDSGVGDEIPEVGYIHEVRDIKDIQMSILQTETVTRLSEKNIQSVFSCLSFNFQKALHGAQKGLFDQVYKTVDKLVNSCSQELMKILPLMEIRNMDEVKHFLPPIQHESCNIVTLGIGRDVKAELELKAKYPHCTFLGVDPDEEVSGRMFKNDLGGLFVKGAVGAEEGEFNASVINKENVGYHQETLRHMSFQNLLDEYNNNRPIDLLLMDVEGSEFGLLPYIINNPGRIPPICQMNVELHFVHNYPPMGNNILDTLYRISNEEKFLMIYAQKVGPFYRMFWINVTDPRCHRTYISN